MYTLVNNNHNNNIIVASLIPDHFLGVAVARQSFRQPFAQRRVADLVAEEHGQQIPLFHVGCLGFVVPVHGMNMNGKSNRTASKYACELTAEYHSNRALRLDCPNEQRANDKAPPERTLSVRIRRGFASRPTQC